MSEDFFLKVWGARGSRQVSDASVQRYGGDTTCFEVRLGDYSLVIDCGSGAMALENDLLERGVRDLDLLLTHSHLDHVIGLPFFCLCYMDRTELRIHVGHMDRDVRGDRPFQALFNPLLFPVPVKLLKALSIKRFHPPLTKTFGPLEVAATRLNHPGGSVGYRISHKGRSVAIITDHEHGDPDIDATLIEFCAGADLMIIDAMYTEDEYAKRVGWGHSTPQEAIKLARAADVPNILLSHHAPYRTDEALDEQVAELQKDFPNLQAAAAGGLYRIGA